MGLFRVISININMWKKMKQFIIWLWKKITCFGKRHPKPKPIDTATYITSESGSSLETESGSKIVIKHNTK